MSLATRVRHLEQTAGTDVEMAWIALGMKDRPNVFPLAPGCIGLAIPDVAKLLAEDMPLLWFARTTR